MKRSIIIVGILMICLSSAFAQTTSNVEKAVRFRAAQKDVTVEVKSEAIEQKSETAVCSVEPFSMKLRSSNQLEELGLRGAPRYVLGWLPNSKQLQELGPRYKWWNVAQLEELGGGATRYLLIWSIGGLPNTTQVKELGPRYPIWWMGCPNAPQLEDLGGNTKRGTCFKP
jgi:hypothetical protein